MNQVTHVMYTHIKAGKKPTKNIMTPTKSIGIASIHEPNMRQKEPLVRLQRSCIATAGPNFSSTTIKGTNAKRTAIMIPGTIRRAVPMATKSVTNM